MDIGQFLAKICRMLRDMFFWSYGDPSQSLCKDLTLPSLDPKAWTLIASIPKSSILVIRNLDAVEEIEITSNENDTVGMRIAADTVYGFERFSGNLYGRSYSVSTQVDINIGIFGLRTTDI